MSLLHEEEDKYNYLHGKKQEYGLGQRQVTWLSTSEEEFPKRLREAIASRYDEEEGFVVRKLILDIGCGGGTVTNYIQHFDKYEPIVMGVDISSEAIKKAEKHFPQCDFLQQSAHNLCGFDDDWEDIVLHLDGLEHIPVEWEKQAISEAIRVCKPGGLLFYEIACGDAWDDHLANWGGYSNVHINVKSPRAWMHLFTSFAGKIKCEYVKDEESRLLLILRKI